MKAVFIRSKNNFMSWAYKKETMTNNWKCRSTTMEPILEDRKKRGQWKIKKIKNNKKKCIQKKVDILCLCKFYLISIGESLKSVRVIREKKQIWYASFSHWMYVSPRWTIFFPCFTKSAQPDIPKQCLP